MSDHAQGRAVFVYYKIDAQNSAQLLPLALHFQQQVKLVWPDLSCELLQRPSASVQGQRTWMEVYRHAEGVSDEMIAAISALAEVLQMPTPRLTEIFVPLA